MGVSHERAGVFAELFADLQVFGADGVDVFAVGPDFVGGAGAACCAAGGAVLNKREKSAIPLQFRGGNEKSKA